jgi:hypothetical protein
LEEDVDELTILNGITMFAELVGYSLDTLVVDAEGDPRTALRISVLRLLIRASALSWKSWRRATHRATAEEASQKTRL